MAKEAEIVVLACGKLHRRYAPAVDATVAALAAAWYPLFCLGRNGDGSPKHPLCLAKTSVLEPFGR